MLPVTELECASGEASSRTITDALQQALRPFLKPSEQQEGSSAGAASSSGAPRPKLYRGTLYNAPTADRWVSVIYHVVMHGKPTGEPLFECIMKVTWSGQW